MDKLRNLAYQVVLFSLFSDDMNIDFTEEEIGLNKEEQIKVFDYVKNFIETMTPEEKDDFKKLSIDAVQQLNKELKEQ